MAGKSRYGWLGVFFLICCGLAVSVGAASLPKYGGTLHLSLLTEPTSLDPAKILLDVDRQLCQLLYDTLVVKDNDGNISPRLAKSWEASPDGKTWTFTLRDGLSFHNGRKITAKDVVYTFKRALLKGAQAKIQPLLGNISGAERYLADPGRDLTGIFSIGESAVQISLNRLDYNFLSKLASPYLSIVPSEDIIEKGDDFFLAPSGSGPFQFTSWERQRKIIFSVNDQYVFGRPYVDQLDFSVIDDPGAGILKFELEELDIYDIPSFDYQRFRDNRVWRDNIRETREVIACFVGINCLKPPFDNPQARKALNYAIDRQSIIDILLAGQGEKSKGVLPAGVRKTLPAPNSFPYDPGFAQKLLVSGISAEEANREIVFWTPNDPPELVRIAERIQVNLLDVGINVYLQEKSWAEIYRALQPEAKGEKPHIFLLSFLARNDNPQTFLTDLFSVKGQYNLFNYRSREVDQLLTLAKQSTSLNERFGMLAKVESIVVDEAPAIFLYYTSRKLIFQPRVMNLEIIQSQPNLIKLWLRQ